MSETTGALSEAREKLNELLENARIGNIIPIRLPGQMEEIAQLLEQAEMDHASEVKAAKAAAMPEDMAAYMDEEAYFVGHAVHELRTPMTSIRGYSDMLGQMGELSDMQKQFLDVIQTNTRRMEGLLTDVSYANKVRKKTLKIQDKMDTFKNIALRVEKAMEDLAASLNRKLTFDIPQGLPILNTDGDMLAVALNKLVENGLKYSAEGEGEVTVSATADGDTLKILVKDNGIGMTPEEIEKLGTIYFRSEDDAVRAHKGSGLGIPIAYGMIELLGGTISVESAKDTGTTWTIEIKGMS